MKVTEVVLWLSANLFILVFGSTPLCLLCPCNSKPNKPPNINCINANISNIFENKLWFDEVQLEPYPIQSLIYRNKLGNLTDHFPLSNLTVLDLSECAINNIGVGVFSHLQTMQELILANNDIHFLKPDVFLGVYVKNEYYPLRSLQKLDVSYNKIHTLHPDTFEHIDEIQVLKLSHNPLRFIDSQTLTAIASLVYLTKLDLSFTQLQTLPHYFIFTPRHLKILDISGNKFYAIPSALNESHSLEILNFNSNPIHTIGKPNAFPRIPTLRFLHLSYMPNLERINTHSFSGLENLEELHMSNNRRLSVISPKAFIKLYKNKEVHIQLKKIFLNNNNLSYLDNNVFDTNSIKVININENPWVCDCSNQWLIDEIVPLYIENKDLAAKHLNCSDLTKTSNLTFYDLYIQEKTMRCSKLLSNEPLDGILLVITLLSVVSVGTVLIMFGMYVYKMKILNGKLLNYPVYHKV